MATFQSDSPLIYKTLQFISSDTTSTGVENKWVCPAGLTGIATFVWQPIGSAVANYQTFENLGPNDYPVQALPANVPFYAYVESEQSRVLLQGTGDGILSIEVRLYIT